MSIISLNLCHNISEHVSCSDVDQIWWSMATHSCKPFLHRSITVLCWPLQWSPGEPSQQIWHQIFSTAMAVPSYLSAPCLRLSTSHPFTLLCFTSYLPNLGCDKKQTVVFVPITVPAVEAKIYIRAKVKKKNTKDVNVFLSFNPTVAVNYCDQLWVFEMNEH